MSAFMESGTVHSANDLDDLMDVAKLQLTWRADEPEHLSNARESPGEFDSEWSLFSTSDEALWRHLARDPGLIYSDYFMAQYRYHRVSLICSLVWRLVSAGEAVCRPNAFC